jgi:hypothetical protein
MKKRDFLLGGVASLAQPLWAQDKFGAKAGYPTGWGPAGQIQKWEGYPEYHVGNFSGGLEKMLAHQVVKASPQPAHFLEAKRKIKASVFMDAFDYANKYNRTGLLIARRGYCNSSGVEIKPKARALTTRIYAQSW